MFEGSARMDSVKDSDVPQLEKEWREGVAGRFVDRSIGMVIA